MKTAHDSAYLAAIINSAADAMVGEDLVGMITSWNPAAERLFGYSAQEVLGRSMSVLLPKERPDEEIELRQRFTAGEHVDHYETIRCRKDGTPFAVLLTVSPIVDAGGRVIGASKIFRDLTAHKEAETALRLSRASLTSILSSAMDAIVSVDDEQRIVFFNEAAERMFRCMASEVQGTKLDRFIPSRYRETHRDHIRQFGDSGNTNRMMGRLGTITGLRVDGEEFPIEASISHVRTDGRSLYTVILRDVTERHRSEAALRESQERVRAIVETAVDGIITIDDHGTIESVNPAVERIFQYAIHELLGQNVKILMPEPYHSQHDHYLERYRETGEKKIIGVGREVFGQRKDGSVFPIELSISETQLPTRRFFTGILRDISARKRAEEELRLLTVELDQRVAVRTQELVRSQARLRALATQLSLAEQRVRRQVASELHDYLGQLLVVARLKLSQTIRAVEDPGLVNQLKEADQAVDSAMSYSRSLVAELTPPVLREFGFSMAVTWLAQQMRRHGLRVELQLSTVDVDLPEEVAVLLFLSVRELLMNVVKHAHTDVATVSLNINPQGDRELTVTDQGRGFDPQGVKIERQGKLEHFGLFSIRERMEALGGRIEIHSAMQQGTRVVLVLPGLRDSTTENGHEGQDVCHAATAPKTAALRVLMVDDHAMVREGIKTILQLYEDLEVVGEAADGEAAVALASQFQPDVIVMDINMPKMDGVEATKRIKQRFPSIVIIGLSVQQADQVDRLMKEAGAATYLTKDQAAERLYKAIKEAVQSAAQKRGPRPDS
ncbi:MAG TPA: PAS domain S-box protein [Nitrospira sp.]|nr:PAS domain S-box protein [Nitrospira sp.]